MKTILLHRSLAKVFALLIIGAYPLIACSDTGNKNDEGHGKHKGDVKHRIFKILNNKIIKDGKVGTVLLLDDNNEIVYVLSKEGKKVGHGRLANLIKKNELVVSTKTLNIIETKGSHFVYFCGGSGDCTKYDLPH